MKHHFYTSGRSTTKVVWIKRVWSRVCSEYCTISSLLPHVCDSYMWSGRVSGEKRDQVSYYNFFAVNSGSEFTMTLHTYIVDFLLFGLQEYRSTI